KLPVVPEVAFSAEDSMSVDAEIEWQEDPNWTLSMQGFLSVVIQFPLRIIALSIAAEVASAAKEAKKREEKAAADIAPGNFKMDKESMAKMVEKAVSKAVAQSKREDKVSFPHLQIYQI